MIKSAAIAITIIFFAGISMFQAKPFNSYAAKWPAQCGSKSYCFLKPDDYPQANFDSLLDGLELEWQPSVDLQNRSSDRFDDVGHCQAYKWVDTVYVIRDNKDQVRYVAQAEKFQIKVAIEECKNPSRITDPYYIEENNLKDNKVYCYDTKLPLHFMVLSLDGRRLESVAIKDGLPVSCSAKIMR